MLTEELVNVGVTIDSRHSFERAKERAGFRGKSAQRLMELARTRGVTSEECSNVQDRLYLKGQSSAEREAVAYNGYCFILDRISRACITLFPLPKYFGKKTVNNKCQIGIGTRSVILRNWEIAVDNL